MTSRTPTVEHLNIEALSALSDDAPVVMLNLMRFRERSLDGNGSGWDAYLRYSALTIKLIKARGGTIAWTGTAEAVALGSPEDMAVVHAGQGGAASRIATARATLGSGGSVGLIEWRVEAGFDHVPTTEDGRKIHRLARKPAAPR